MRLLKRVVWYSVSESAWAQSSELANKYVWDRVWFHIEERVWSQVYERVDEYVWKHIYREITYLIWKARHREVA